MQTVKSLRVPLAILLLLLVVNAFHLGSVAKAQMQSAEKFRLPTMEEVKPEAEKGDPVAQYQLGLIYWVGYEGTAFNGNRDPDEAMKWFRKSADQNNVLAELMLGQILLQGYGGPTLDGTNPNQNPAQAAAWFQKAADQKNPQGQVALGQLYLKGLGVAEDPQKAMRLFLLAADQQYVPVYSQLAWMFGQGIGVKADVEQEVAFTRRAADHGDLEACYQMSIFYEEGHGVNKDEAQAELWLAEAAKGGSVRAVQRLFEKSEAGELSDSGLKTVAEIVEQRARRGDLESAFHLGFLYAEGLGVPKDVHEAQKWFEIGGTGWHKRQLADIYAEGRLVPRDDKRAFQLYQEAGAAGPLAKMYAEGRGVPQDYTKAAEQLHNAAVANHSDAQIAYGEYLFAGRGVPKDPVAGMYWIRRGAQRRLGDALTGVGIDYFAVRSVPQDKRMANIWYRRATTYDMDIAELDLAHDLLKGEGIQKDPIEACAWLTIANPQLNSAGGELATLTKDAPLEMLERIKNRVEELQKVRQVSGGYYENSDPYSTATPDIESLKKAAASGNPLAEMRLAYAYEKGQGVPVDPDQAIQLYKHLQKAGPTELQAWLGVALANGDGVPQDFELARDRLVDAAGERSILALKTLAMLDREGKGSDPSVINAYMWLSLADSDPEAAKEMSELATEMKPEEISRAKSLAADWRSKHPAPAQ
jgi:hypothetical protein